MQKDTITVIIPVYDVEPYLKRCIDSVLSQTYLNLEVILATDGPESCDQICKEYQEKDSRVKLIMHPGSYGKAFNQALETASGGFIGIVESDDWCAPCMFERLYTRAVETSADIVKCYFYNAYNNRKRPAVFDYIPEVLNVEDFPLFISLQPAVWSMLYRKDFLEKNNIKMIEDRISYIDVHFHIETAIRAKKIALYKHPLYYYYHGNPKQSVKSTEKINDAIISLQFAFTRLKEILANNRKISSGFLRAVICHLMWNYERVGSGNLREFWDSAGKYVSLINSSTGTDLGMCDDLQKLFFYSLLSDATYENFEKNKSKLVSRKRITFIKLLHKLHMDKFLYRNVPFVKIVSCGELRKLYLFGIVFLSRIRKDNMFIYKLFNIITLRKKAVL